MQLAVRALLNEAMVVVCDGGIKVVIVCIKKGEGAGYFRSP